MRDRITQALTEHRASGLWRVHHRREGLQQPTVSYEKPLLNFNSNDYLGLSHHPALAQALAEGATRYGSGSGSANTLSGYTRAHESLIEKIRDWLKVEDVLLFSSGYIANLAVLSTIPQKTDHIYMDRLAHASLLDGAQMGEAAFRRYPHQRLDTVARWASKHPAWIVTESLFGMDGDQTDIKALCEMAMQTKALIYLDEAHALGLYGETGAGLIGNHPVPLRLGTFGKALGLQGAFVAGDQDLIEYCRQFARPYLFTTALSPAIAYAAERAIALVQADNDARKTMQRLIAYFKHHMASIGMHTASDSYIQIIQMPDCESTNRAAALLRDHDIFVSSIRYPTVPKESPRLRISITAQHSEADLDKLIAGLKEVRDAILV